MRPLFLLLFAFLYNLFTLSGALASFVERYEFGPIDDNVLIATASTILLIIGATFGPLV